MFRAARSSMGRRDAMSAVLLLFVIMSIQGHGSVSGQSLDSAASDDSRPDPRPNVLMICVDDLNDWIEPLGGHPDVRTPTMQALADRGINFANAHCQAPLCNSSRTSVLTSMRPSTTGVYGLDPWFRELSTMKDVVSLPQAFARAGYQTLSAGKVYHNNWGREPAEGMSPEFDVWGPRGGPGVMPPKKIIPPTPINNNRWVDWGVFDHDEADKGDAIVASWAESTLRKIDHDRPFFMAVGFFMPHVPCYATQKWWDMYDHDRLTLPTIDRSDRLDCSPFAWYLHWATASPRLSWLDHHDERRNFVHAYLSCISFVDAQIGRVLRTLRQTGLEDNTIVCLWSDHGYHLGEKNITGKVSLWQRSTHVPLMFAGPNISMGRCDAPAELLDVYPTLCELAGVDIPPSVQGRSLVPQLRDPNRATIKPALTDHNPGNHSVRDERYRLIHYADGSEELYDGLLDRDEQRNRIDDPSLRAVADRLRRFVPTTSAELAPGSRTRTLEKREDGWYWQTKKIDPDHPPMSIEPHTPADLRAIESSTSD